MANKSKGFVLVADKRPSGEAYWLVRGSLGGKQIRREFPDRIEALAYAEQKNSELRGHPADHSAVVTRLLSAQVRDAEVAFAQLSNEFPDLKLLDLVEYYRGLSGTFSLEEAKRIGPAIKRLKTKYPDANVAVAVDWLVANYRPPKNTLTLEKALEHYLADAARRYDTGSLSKPQFDRIGYAMAQLEGHFGKDEPLVNLGTARLQDFLRKTTRAKDGSLAYSNKTWVNRRGYLTAFAEYCRLEGWLDDNPASGIRNYKKKDLPTPEPSILSVEQAAKLMAYLETYEGGRLVPFYALCLFAGIRPDWDNGEISKLKPEHFNLAQRQLKLPGEITKTGKTRIVVLQPNLLKWLRAYPLTKMPITFVGFETLHVRARQKHKLGHDVLRHTYCSMLVGKYRSVADTALQAGNSESVMWSNYLNLVNQSVANKFWQIVPKHKLRAES